jgi:cytochrome c-type biogenesis protein
MGIAFSSFLLGLLATFNPCILPLYPAYLAYLGIQAGTGINRQRYFLGFFVLAGVLTMMIALGALIAVLSISIGRLLAYLIPIADLLLLVLGVLLLLDRSPFKMLPVIQVPFLRHPFLNAYAYGLLYGPISLPCSGPLVVSIFTLSLTVGEALGKLAVFLCFGLGFGLPLLVLSLLSGGLQRQLTRLVARHNRLVTLISGLLLIGIAIYDLALNWGMLWLFFFHRP